MTEFDYKDMKDKRLHFLGIGGRGISAMALIAQQLGAKVTGCDKGTSYTTEALQQAGIPVELGHSPDHLENIDALVYVPAMMTYDPDNTELSEAKARGIPNLIWQDYLGKWSDGMCALSVSGVHGKGTTTTLLSYMLLDAGYDPTCFVGAVVPRFNSSFRLGNSNYFVNEADEYNHNFWHFHPRVAVVTSIEYEHPEFFPGMESMLFAFEGFIRGMDMHGDYPFPPTAVINAGNAGCRQLIERLRDWPGNIVTYAVEPALPEATNLRVNYFAYDIQEDGITRFRVSTQGLDGEQFPEGRTFSYQLPGLYNLENGLAALAAAHAAGIPFTSVLKSLEEYQGVKRRFELRHQGPLEIDGEQRDVVLIDDYAHHPTAITLTLAATRHRFPGRRLIVAYQPDMFTRTIALFDDFVKAFEGADVVIMADINPGRERDKGLMHARDLVKAIAERPHFAQHPERIVLYGGTLANIEQQLRDILRSGDVAVIMGSGTIYTVTKHLLHEK